MTYEKLDKARSLAGKVEAFRRDADYYNRLAERFGEATKGEGNRSDQYEFGKLATLSDVYCTDDYKRVRDAMCNAAMVQLVTIAEELAVKAEELQKEFDEL